MTVYVDALRPTPRSRKWPFAEGAHMLADSIDELHRFAASIGLKRAWFQPESSPHYDLNAGRHAAALKKGAQLIDRMKLVELIRKHRQEKNDAQPR